MAAAKKTRESSARVKGSFVTLVANPKVDKSSPTGDADMSDMLKSNFVLSPSICAELVDQIRQASDLGIFSSLFLKK